MDEYGKKEGEALWKKAAPAKEGKKEVKKVEDKVQEVTLERAEGEPIGWSRDGVYILEVEEDSAAAKAGVKKSVKIVSVNEKKVNGRTLAEVLKEAGNSAKLGLVEVRTDKSDPDGKMFTYAEFLTFYADEGAQKWKSAKPRVRKERAEKKEGEEKKEDTKEEEKKEE